MNAEKLKRIESRFPRITKETVGITFMLIGVALAAAAARDALIERNQIIKNMDKIYPSISDSAVESANNKILLFDQKINQSIPLTNKEATEFNNDKQIIATNNQEEEYFTTQLNKSRILNPDLYILAISPMIMLSGAVLLTPGEMV